MPKRERKVEMCVKIDVSSYFNMGASKNSGTPKWMVVMENPIKIDDLGGKPTIFGNIHMFQCYFLHVLSRKKNPSLLATPTLLRRLRALEEAVRTLQGICEEQDGRI